MSDKDVDGFLNDLEKLGTFGTVRKNVDLNSITGTTGGEGMSNTDMAPGKAAYIGLILEIIGGPTISSFRPKSNQVIGALSYADATIKKQAAEIEDLKHDIARYVEANTELVNDAEINTEFKALLKRKIAALEAERDTLRQRIAELEAVITDIDYGQPISHSLPPM